MNTAIVTERIAEASPLFKARIAGILYLRAAPPSQQEPRLARYIPEARFSSYSKCQHFQPLCAVDFPEWRRIPELVYARSIGGARACVHQAPHVRLRHCVSIFWSSLPRRRLPSFQVHFFPAHSGYRAGAWRGGLYGQHFGDCYSTPDRSSPLSLHHGACGGRRSIADSMAHHRRCERSEMEGAGEHSGLRSEQRD